MCPKEKQAHLREGVRSRLPGRVPLRICRFLCALVALSAFLDDAGITSFASALAQMFQQATSSGGAVSLSADQISTLASCISSQVSPGTGPGAELVLRALRKNGFRATNDSTKRPVDTTLGPLRIRPAKNALSDPHERRSEELDSGLVSPLAIALQETRLPPTTTTVRRFRDLFSGYDEHHAHGCLVIRIPPLHRRAPHREADSRWKLFACPPQRHLLEDPCHLLPQR